jgi:shikimate dehydrogenase
MLLGVCGKPIIHSASPVLHKAGLRSCGFIGESIRLLVNSASEAMQLSNKLGLRGLNVTAPFKESISTLIDRLSHESIAVGAVNTVVFDGTTSTGHNTDIYGIKHSLSRLLQDCKISSAVILGAGGAAKAAAQALKELEISFSIINRSAQRAQSLAQLYGQTFYLFSDQEGQKQIENSELIINCLASLEMPFSGNLISKQKFILDSHYKAESAIFKRSQEVGIKTLNGYDWLILQSQKSQELFLGIAPSYEALEHALRDNPTLVSKNNIALVGLMGSGKSSVAKELSELLEYDLIDLDREIEREADSSVTELFSSVGEKGFRDLETKMLKRVCVEHRLRPYVLACGGGVPLSQENCELLKNDHKVFWLWASVQKLNLRLKQTVDRPLLASTDKLSTLEDLLQQRKLSYARSADFVVDTDLMPEAEVAQLIYSEINI